MPDDVPAKRRSKRLASKIVEQHPFEQAEAVVAQPSARRSRRKSRPKRRKAKQAAAQAVDEEHETANGSSSSGQKEAPSSSSSSDAEEEEEDVMRSGRLRRQRGARRGAKQRGGAGGPSPAAPRKRVNFVAGGNDKWSGSEGDSDGLSDFVVDSSDTSASGGGEEEDAVSRSQSSEDGSGGGARAGRQRQPVAAELSGDEGGDAGMQEMAVQEVVEDAVEDDVEKAARPGKRPRVLLDDDDDDDDAIEAIDLTATTVMPVAPAPSTGAPHPSTVPSSPLEQGIGGANGRDVAGEEGPPTAGASPGVGQAAAAEEGGRKLLRRLHKPATGQGSRDGSRWRFRERPKAHVDSVKERMNSFQKRALDSEDESEEGSQEEEEEEEDEVGGVMLDDDYGGGEEAVGKVQRRQVIVLDSDSDSDADRPKPSDGPTQQGHTAGPSATQPTHHYQPPVRGGQGVRRRAGKAAVVAEDADRASKKKRASVEAALIDVFGPTRSEKESFVIYVEYLLMCIIDPTYAQRVENNKAHRKYYHMAIKRAEERICDRREWSITSNSWRTAKDGFVQALQQRPRLDCGWVHDGTRGRDILEDIDLLFGDTCDACGRSRSHATRTLTLSGRPCEPLWLYGNAHTTGQLGQTPVKDVHWRPSEFDSGSQQSDGGGSDAGRSSSRRMRSGRKASSRGGGGDHAVPSEEVFRVGRFCAARVKLYHALWHFKRRLMNNLKQRLKTERAKMKRTGEAGGWEEAAERLLKTDVLSLYETYEELMSIAVDYSTQDIKEESWVAKNQNMDERIDNLLRHVYNAQDDYDVQPNISDDSGSDEAAGGEDEEDEEEAMLSKGESSLEHNGATAGELGPGPSSPINDATASAPASDPRASDPKATDPKATDPGATQPGLTYTTTPPPATAAQPAALRDQAPPTYTAQAQAPGLPPGPTSACTAGTTCPVIEGPSGTHTGPGGTDRPPGPSTCDPTVGPVEGNERHMVGRDVACQTSGTDGVAAEDVRTPSAAVVSGTCEVGVDATGGPQGGGGLWLRSLSPLSGTKSRQSDIRSFLSPKR